MTSVLNTHDYELMANNPQDISSDFLFVIHPQNDEKHTEEAIGWSKNGNFIVISALANLKKTRKDIDFTLSLDFADDSDIIKDIQLFMNNKDFLHDFNGDLLFDIKISVGGGRTYYINHLGEWQTVKFIDIDEKKAVDSLDNEFLFIDNKWMASK